MTKTEINAAIVAEARAKIKDLGVQDQAESQEQREDWLYPQDLSRATRW